MKVHIVYHVDDDAPLDMVVEADNPADLYSAAQNALSAMQWSCLDRIRAKMAHAFPPSNEHPKD